MIALMKATLYLQVLHDADKGKALLAKIKTDYPGTRVAAAADRAGAPQPQVLAAFAFDPAERDPAKSVSRNLYGVSGIPTTYIIDKEGKVAASVVGFGGDSDTRLEAALGAAGVKAAAAE